MTEEHDPTRAERAGRPSGDRGLLVDVAAADLRTASRRARALARRVADARLDEVEEAVPGATTVLVVLRPGAAPSGRLASLLAEPLEAQVLAAAGHLHEIAVRYGGTDGPDLEEVARMHGLSPDEVVRRHASADYEVGFVGFSPGFAYLVGLPQELATPRLAAPRTRIPAGSVAIGGELTGIYPRATPGGWRLLGRTEAVLFDPCRDPPALLAPGDRVRFQPR